MRTLTEFEEEALKELFNISFGYAATSLSQIVNCNVDLSVPSLSIYSGQQIRTHPPLDLLDITMVAQRFDGGLSADAVLAFPGSRTLELARLMIKEDLTEDELGELEHEALTEIGNVVLNSCISVISDILKIKFKCEMPRYINGSILQLLPDEPGDIYTLLVATIEMSIATKNIRGQIMFLMNIHSIDNFLPLLLKYMRLPP